MKHISVLLILLYQRYISPRKGFVCSHKFITGGNSCSEYGKRTIKRFGLLKGGKLTFRRLNACGNLHKQYLNNKQNDDAAKCCLATDLSCNACLIFGG